MIGVSISIYYGCGGEHQRLLGVWCASTRSGEALLTVSPLLFVQQSVGAVREDGEGKDKR